MAQGGLRPQEGVQIDEDDEDITIEDAMAEQPLVNQAVDHGMGSGPE